MRLLPGTCSEGHGCSKQHEPPKQQLMDSKCPTCIKRARKAERGVQGQEVVEVGGACPWVALREPAVAGQVGC